MEEEELVFLLIIIIYHLFCFRYFLTERKTLFWCYFSTKVLVHCFSFFSQNFKFKQIKFTKKINKTGPIFQFLTSTDAHAPPVVSSTVAGADLCKASLSCRAREQQALQIRCPHAYGRVPVTP
jgi:hypothetical protein